MGGCIVKSSHHAGGLCLQVKPRERERRRREEEKTRKGKENNTLTRALKTEQFSGYRREAMSKRNPTSKKPKTEGTFPPTQSTNKAEEEKSTSQKKSSILCCFQYHSKTETTRLGYSKFSANNCPSEDLSQEELSKTNKQETNSTLKR